MSLNEPYVNEGRIFGPPSGYTQVSSKGSCFRAALQVSKPVFLSAVKKLSDAVAFPCMFFKEQVLRVTCYGAHSKEIELVLDSLEQLLGLFPGENVIHVGEFNAKSMIWGQTTH